MRHVVVRHVVVRHVVVRHVVVRHVVVCFCRLMVLGCFFLCQKVPGVFLTCLCANWQFACFSSETLWFLCLGCVARKPCVVFCWRGMWFSGISPVDLRALFEPPVLRVLCSNRTVQNLIIMFSIKHWFFCIFLWQIVFVFLYHCFLGSHHCSEEPVSLYWRQNTWDSLGIQGWGQGHEICLRGVAGRGQKTSKSSTFVQQVKRKLPLHCEIWRLKFSAFGGPGPCWIRWMSFWFCSTGWIQFRFQMGRDLLSRNQMFPSDT